jgi:hypothetical protein
LFTHSAVEKEIKVKSDIILLKRDMDVQKKTLKRRKEI